MELGLSLLAQAQFPFKFWFDVFVSVVFLINCLPTQTLNHKSPFECLFQKVPDYTFLKVFGCACYPFLGLYNTHKLQFRTSKCLFLGYSPAHKGYRCLHPSGRLYIAKTVHFDEYEFPYHSLFSSANGRSASTSINSTLVLVNNLFFQNDISHLMSSLPTQGVPLNSITTESSQPADRNDIHSFEPTTPSHSSSENSNSSDQTSHLQSSPHA